MSRKDKTSEQGISGIGRILGQPRRVRIGIAILYSLAVTYLLFSIVDTLYIRYFFSMDTLILPSLITGGIGLVTYMLGWYLLVGNQQSPPEMRFVTLWYLVLGGIAVLLAAFSLIRYIIILILAFT